MNIRLAGRQEFQKCFEHLLIYFCSKQLIFSATGNRVSILCVSFVISMNGDDGGRCKSNFG